MTVKDGKVMHVASAGKRAAALDSWFQKNYTHIVEGSLEDPVPPKTVKEKHAAISTAFRESIATTALCVRRGYHELIGLPPFLPPIPPLADTIWGKRRLADKVPDSWPVEVPWVKPPSSFTQADFAAVFGWLQDAGYSHLFTYDLTPLRVPPAAGSAAAGAPASGEDT